MVAVLSVISMHTQKKSLLDYQEIDLGAYADGKPVLCHFNTIFGPTLTLTSPTSNSII